jgi:uncharacterized protein (TIGR01777 family)
MSKKVLITGASGLIGSRLTELLLQKDYHVFHLGRSRREGRVPSFVWNVGSNEIEPEALQQAEVIIHLAGAGVTEKRWTTKRKKEILESRTHSTALLYKALSTQSHSVKTFIASSAIGYYGCSVDERIYTESSPPGADFLAQVTRQWEEEADKISALNIRVVKLRTGIVLSNRGGALPQLAMPVRWGVGAALGTGRQYMSWIHIDDLCGLYIKAIEDENMRGAYNAVCGDVTNRDMVKAIARVLRKPLLLPPVPGLLLKIMIGEAAQIVINGAKVSSEKIRQAGFVFQYPVLEEALQNLLVSEIK